MGKTNAQYESPDWLNWYFKKFEPGNRLETPPYKYKLGGNIKERQSIGKQVKDQSSIPKKLIDKKEGFKIFEVDDNYIKTNIYADFTEGGNGYAYPNFVPMNEI